MQVARAPFLPGAITCAGRPFRKPINRDVEESFSPALSAMDRRQFLLKSQSPLLQTNKLLLAYDDVVQNFNVQKPPSLNCLPG